MDSSKWIMHFFNGNILIDYIWLLCIQTGVFMLGEIIMHQRIKFMSKVPGYNTQYNLFSLIGTPVHELGHLIMCLLFFCKPMSVKLFPGRNNRQLGNGMVQLGYVNYSWNKNNIWQNSIGQMMIATGPIYSGSAVIGFIIFLFNKPLFAKICAMIREVLASDDSAVTYFRKNGSELLQGFISLLFPNAVFGVLWVVIFSVAMHMNLSRQDMKGYARGSFVLGCILFMCCWIPSTVPYIGQIGSLIQSAIAVITQIITSVSFLALTLQIISLVVAFSLGTLCSVLKDGRRG